jgi:hypothetical protein
MSILHDTLEKAGFRALPGKKTYTTFSVINLFKPLMNTPPCRPEPTEFSDREIGCEIVFEVEFQTSFALLYPLSTVGKRMFRQNGY